MSAADFWWFVRTGLALGAGVATGIVCCVFVCLVGFSVLQLLIK